MFTMKIVGTFTTDMRGTEKRFNYMDTWMQQSENLTLTFTT